MHLGMSGSFRVQRPAGAQRTDARAERYTDGRHDHVVFRMSSGVTITFNDPRRFGSMDLVSHEDLLRHATLSGLGPEPLDAAFDSEALARACAGKKTSLKAALSDQRVVAGSATSMYAEALHRARLAEAPRRPCECTGVLRESARHLVAAIKQVLNGVAPQPGVAAGRRCAGRGCVVFPKPFSRLRS
jgi:formamidopyrimidine-DNA glycosylase